MKETVLVRRIDDLGRVVIPKDFRRHLHFREGDPLEIYLTKEGVLIKRFNPASNLPWDGFNDYYWNHVDKMTEEERREWSNHLESLSNIVDLIAKRGE